jgi:hypothetical protein
MNATAVHEASHCACAYLLNRHVSYTWRALGSVWEDEQLGHANIEIGPTLGPERLVIALIGYLSVNTPGWPPPFEEAVDEELEALGLLLRHLDADPERYRRIVQFTEELLEDPHFIRLRDAIARALTRFHFIDAEAIEDLARINFPEPEGVAA